MSLLQGQTHTRQSFVCRVGFTFSSLCCRLLHATISGIFSSSLSHSTCLSVSSFSFFHFLYITQGHSVFPAGSPAHNGSPPEAGYVSYTRTLRYTRRKKKEALYCLHVVRITKSGHRKAHVSMRLIGNKMSV